MAPDTVMQIDAKSHWESVYNRNAANAVSWYREHLETSIRLIRKAGLATEAAFLDVGGGHSTLVDDLLAAGFTNLTVLDIAGAALAATRRRLGPAAERVTWITGDVLSVSMNEAHFDLWHDRAVFHFLTRPEDRDAYVRQLLHALRPGGHAIIAPFGPEGPMKCSGLDICRYDADSLAHTLGTGFALEESAMELHETPAGKSQQFLYGLFRRV
ncbi:MAG: class I SAM-dependent methyltransferase [Terracidiphilus sp.]